MNMTSAYQLSGTDRSISIYYNKNFTLDDVESVLYPLFGGYYGKQRLQEVIESTEHIWCVYDHQSARFIACALLSDRDNQKTLYVKLFGVEKSSQGRGIGTRLLKAIQRWAKKKNYLALMLHTQTNNYAAIHLYEKAGFRKQFYMKNFFRRRAHLWLDFTFQPDAYQMICYL